MVDVHFFGLNAGEYVKSFRIRYSCNLFHVQETALNVKPRIANTYEARGEYRNQCPHMRLRYSSRYLCEYLNATCRT